MGTAYSTIVEFNTMFITLQRLFKWKLCQLGFYGTWVTMRLGWFPYLVYFYHKTLTTDGVFPAETVQPLSYTWNQVVGSQIALCGLNFLWTGEVVYGMLKPKKKPAKKE